MRLRGSVCAAFAGGLLVGFGAGVPALAAAPCPGPATTYAMTARPWPVEMLQPERVWPLTRGAGVTVAVIDSGVSAGHSQLAQAVVAGLDLVPGKDKGKSDGTTDCVGHGTLVAGLIAGREKAGRPFVGIAPDANILPLRILPDMKRRRGDETPKAVAKAVNAAVDRKVDVINLSLTIGPNQPELRSAIARAIAADIVVVAAVGNDGDTALPTAYPAAYPGVIGVAGVDQNGAHVPSSSVGDFVDIAAPGAMIEGPAAGGSDRYVGTEKGGTSFAAPFVAATAALVRAYYPAMHASEVAERILGTADPLPAATQAQVGRGMVNPYRAVAAITVAKAGVPAQKGRPLPPAHMEVDPLAAAKTVAVAAAGGSVVLAALLFIGAHVIPRGRRRGWRPGRASSSSARS